MKRALAESSDGSASDVIAYHEGHDSCSEADEDESSVRNSCPVPRATPVGQTIVDEMKWSFARRPCTGLRTPRPDRSAPFEFMVLSVEAPDKNASVLYLYGVTADGQSVFVSVRGFHHYFWIHSTSKDYNDLACALERDNNALTAFDVKRRKSGGAGPIRSLTVHRRRPLVYYRANANEEGDEFIRVTLETPVDMYDVRRFYNALPKCELFEESGVDYPTRFMVDTGVVGFGWLRVDWENLRVSTGVSTCAYEFKVQYDALSTFEREEVAPLRILTFDIECAARANKFPTPDKDPVIQIAVNIKEMGDNDRVLLDTVLYTRETDPIGGECVMAHYSNERALLQGFCKLIRACDPDIFRGFNQRRFDWVYLFDRAEKLGVKSFGHMSRLVSTPGSIKRGGNFESKAHGKRDFSDAVIPGRCDWDICEIVRREYKNLRSYKLNNISMHFLNETKEDVHHSMITKLYNGDSHDRNRLARYCQKDAILPARIDEKLLLLLRYVELARVCGVTLDTLVRRGQQIKVLSQMLRLARDNGLVLPVKQRLTPYVLDGQYEGATVVEPDVGFYKRPVATLDFSSLYPSIIIAWNLCYTTLIPRDEVKNYAKDQYYTSPAGHSFVNREIRQGMLPKLLETLLARRKRAKADMKAEAKKGNTFGEAVQNSRQLALKISANSVYGFTGVPAKSGGMLPCFEISESVTSIGRESLHRCIDYVHTNFENARVRYGDTDSIMVETGHETVPEAMAWMNDIGPKMTADLFGSRPPMNLAPEKVFWWWLLLSKKRYIGGYWTRPDKMDMIYYTGVEAVRRDNCPIVGATMRKCSEYIFEKHDIEGAVQHAKDVIESLYLNQVDMSQLLISKSLSQEVENYATQQAHTVLATKIAKRDPGNAPSVGDRIPYVMVECSSGRPTDMAEDPLYAINHQVPLNITYYIENQLRKPLTRFFKHIIGEARTEGIFRGEHTRRRVRPPMPEKPKKGSIMAFAVVKKTCKECRATFDPKKTKNGFLCQACVQEHGPKLLEEKRAAKNEAQARYDEVFAVCQKCQGSDRDPVLCVARDCPILYKRKDLESRLNRAVKDIEDLCI